MSRRRNSDFNRTLHRPAKPEDEFSTYPRILHPAAGPQNQVPSSIEPFIFLRSRKRLFQFPTWSPTERDYALGRSVDASAKLGEICGYHQSWCSCVSFQFSVISFQQKVRVCNNDSLPTQDEPEGGV